MLWPIAQTNQRITTLERLIWNEVIKDGWRTKMFHLTTHWGHVTFYGESCPLCCFLCKHDKSRDVCSNSQRAETQAFLSASVFTWTPPTALEWPPLFRARLHMLLTLEFQMSPTGSVLWFCAFLSLTCVIYFGHRIYFMYCIRSNYSINIRFLLHTKLWTLLRFEY